MNIIIFETIIALQMDGNTPRNLWGGYIKSNKTLLKGIMMTPGFTQALYSFLLALVGLAVIFLIMYVVYYLIYNYHPQFFFICHSTAFSVFMNGYYKDMRRHIEYLSTFPEKVAASKIYSLYCELAQYNPASTIKSTIGRDIAEVSDFSDAELEHIFRFWTSLKNPKHSLSKMDLALIDEDKYLEDGEVNPGNVELQGLVEKAEKMRSLREKVSSLKSTLNTHEMESSFASGIVGSLDPLKLYWIKLIIEGRMGDDPTLSELFVTVPVTGYPLRKLRTKHIKLDKEGCTSRPLTDNERIYLEALNFVEKTRNKKDVVLNIINELISEVPISSAEKPKESTFQTNMNKLTNEPKEDPNKKPMMTPMIKTNALEETSAIFNAIMAVYELDLMLNYYLYDIRLGYETRKSGYRLNFVIWTYYWWPYAQWLYEIKIKKQIWEKFPQKFKKQMVDFMSWWVTIPEKLSDLPMTLAGENFQPSQDDRFPILNALSQFLRVTNSNNKKPDVVEHFGFLKGLLSIGKFFTSILDVAKAMANAITNPIKFLTMLIGFVIGIVCMMIYTILNFIADLVIAPIIAWIMVFLPSMFITLWYSLKLLPTTFIYAILWVLDMLLGGIIMAILRCENIPDKWYKYSAYAYGNYYRRMVMCGYKCAKRYEPIDFFLPITLCKRIESIKPDFCPQQNLFKIFKGVSISEPAHFREFEASPKIAFMKDRERQSYLEDVERIRDDFNGACRSCFEDDIKYDDNNRIDLDGHNYMHIANVLCKFTSQLAGTDGTDGKEGKTKLKRVCDLCDTMYGTGKPMYPEVDDNVDYYKFTMNHTRPAYREGFNEEVKETHGKDPYVKGMIMFAGAIIAVAMVTYFVHACNITGGTTVANMDVNLKKLYQKVNFIPLKHIEDLREEGLTQGNDSQTSYGVQRV